MSGLRSPPVMRRGVLEFGRPRMVKAVIFFTVIRLTLYCNCGSRSIFF